MRRCRSWPIGWPRIWPAALGLIMKSGCADPDSGEDHLVAGGNGRSTAAPSTNGHSGHAAVGNSQPDHEPIYGPTYLPRKFKTGIGLPGDNCIDIYANDLGLMAICENFRIIGYNVLVGGGMGVVPMRRSRSPPWPSEWLSCGPIKSSTWRPR